MNVGEKNWTPSRYTRTVVVVVNNDYSRRGSRRAISRIENSIFRRRGVGFTDTLYISHGCLMVLRPGDEPPAYREKTRSGSLMRRIMGFRRAGFAGARLLQLPGGIRPS